jgi:hypothetical protein
LRRGYLIDIGIRGKVAFFTSIPALIFFASCGYRVAGQTTGLPESVRTIAINVFENDSLEPNIESAVTRAVTQKFIDDGRLRVVPQGRADAVLTGTVQRYNLEALSFDRFNYVTEYRLGLEVSVTLQGRAESGIRLKKNVKAETFYRLGQSIVEAESARLKAIDTASGIIADNIVGLLLEGF